MEKGQGRGRQARSHWKMCPHTPLTTPGCPNPPLLQHLSYGTHQENRSALVSGLVTDVDRTQAS